MTTYSCDTNPEEGDREPEPQQLAQTFMVGKWTFHSYRKSHDGKTLILHMKDGIQVMQGDKVVEYKMNLAHHNPREFIFSPDNQSVAFWAPAEEDQPTKRIAVMSLGKLGSKADYRVIYTPEYGREPYGMEWTPDQKFLLVVEKQHKDGVDYSILSRLAMPGGRVRELFRTVGKIDFFMPPVSRFEGGAGVSKDPYKIIFGCENGLYLIDALTGQDRQRLSRLPAMGLSNIEWNPDPKKNQVALYFRNPAAAPDGSRFEGLYLVDLDKMASATAGADGLIDSKLFMEQLHRKRDLHTLWFSPKGTYVTWASNEAIFFRRPEDPPEKTAVIEILDGDENPRRIKGVTWDDKENKLAFTADNQVWVYDLDPPEKLMAKAKKKAEAAHKAAVEAAKKAGQPEPELVEEDPVDASIEAVTGKKPYRYIVREFTKGFTAEPQWVGERVVLTLFEEARDEMRIIRSKVAASSVPSVRKADIEQR